MQPCLWPPCFYCWLILLHHQYMIHKTKFTFRLSQSDRVQHCICSWVTLIIWNYRVNLIKKIQSLTYYFRSWLSIAMLCESAVNPWPHLNAQHFLCLDSRKEGQRSAGCLPSSQKHQIWEQRSVFFLCSHVFSALLGLYLTTWSPSRRPMLWLALYK